MRAAIEAAPDLHPKLSAMAILNGDDFSARLNRAIERSRTDLPTQGDRGGWSEL